MNFDAIPKFAETHKDFIFCLPNSQPLRRIFMQTKFPGDQVTGVINSASATIGYFNFLVETRREY